MSEHKEEAIHSNENPLHGEDQLVDLGDIEVWKDEVDEDLDDILDMVIKLPPGERLSVNQIISKPANGGQTTTELTTAKKRALAQLVRQWVSDNAPGFQAEYVLNIDGQEVVTQKPRSIKAADLVDIRFWDSKEQPKPEGEKKLIDRPIEFNGKCQHCGFPVTISGTLRYRSGETDGIVQAGDQEYKTGYEKAWGWDIGFVCPSPTNLPTKEFPLPHMMRMWSGRGKK